jgi:holo-[acyl-carrier protein] synthase
MGGGSFSGASPTLGTGWRDGIAWRDVEVTRRPSGSPRLVLAGRCAQLAQERRIAEWHVTLSHTPVSAMASVIACGTPEGSPRP